MPRYTETSFDVLYNKIELKHWSQESGYRIPARSRGSFGRKICGWCGEEYRDVGHYAEHVLSEHKDQLKPLKSAKKRLKL